MKTYCHLVEVAELKEFSDEPGCRIVDCRFDLMQPDKGRKEYLEGHIPGAVFADLDRDLAGPVTDASGRHPLPDTQSFNATLQGFGIGPDTQVVVYDYASGALAARLWWLLRCFGHPAVAVLNGGLKAWVASGEPLETDVPDYPETVLEASPDTSLVATTAEISRALEEGRNYTLLDARDRARFDGQTEPIDAVAGHIPGSINFPFADSLNDDGTWKSAEELRQLWAELPGTEPERPLTVMCGSGVTACHLALSAEIAGLAAPRVYVGSWSEWIRDPSRPVAAA